MKYMGSKRRFRKKLHEIIFAQRKRDQFYVEPFLGGANAMVGVPGNKIAGEYNRYIAAMWQELLNGWIPTKINKDDYIKIRDNKDDYDAHIVGWTGINCSYSGKWFAGYAGTVNTKDGIRDYQDEAIRNTVKQVAELKGLVVHHCSYDELNIPRCSVIYCDPPYRGTTGYKDEFDHDKFWEWCRDKIKEGHMLFVSEYTAPEDFICVWSQEASSSLSANGKIGKNKKSVERLFVHKSQYIKEPSLFDFMG